MRLLRASDIIISRRFLKSNDRSLYNILDIYTSIVEAKLRFDVGAAILQDQSVFSRRLNERRSFFKLITDSKRRSRIAWYSALKHRFVKPDRAFTITRYTTLAKSWREPFRLIECYYIAACREMTRRTRNRCANRLQLRAGLSWH